MTKSQCHLLISGRVQGVSFRVNAQRKARELGLTGFIRNLADGRVEALLQGAEPALSQMIEWCKQGPRGASVTQIEINWQALETTCDSFQVLPDGGN